MSVERLVVGVAIATVVLMLIAIGAITTLFQYIIQALP